MPASPQYHCAPCTGHKAQRIWWRACALRLRCATAVRFDQRKPRRIITVLLGVLIFPVMEVAYVVGWMVIPEEVPFGMQAPYAPASPPGSSGTAVQSSDVLS